MKKIIFSAILLAFVLVSCNQKSKEATTEHSHTMGDTTTMDDNSTMMNDKTKTMENHEQMYACPMHPEVQGKMNDKCSKCGMKLTEPVPEKTEESK
jgi:PBP1b-binding outer membrane lipoprotein LpoB